MEENRALLNIIFAPMAQYIVQQLIPQLGFVLKGPVIAAAKVVGAQLDGPQLRVAGLKQYAQQKFLPLRKSCQNPSS